MRVPDEVSVMEKQTSELDWYWSDVVPAVVLLEGGHSERFCEALFVNDRSAWRTMMRVLVVSGLLKHRRLDLDEILRMREVEQRQSNRNASGRGSKRKVPKEGRRFRPQPAEDDILRLSL